MKAQNLEAMCRGRRLSPVARHEHGSRIILVADGWLPDHPQFRGPHYQTLWAVGKDEDHLEVGRPLFFKGGVGSSKRANRIAEALKDAREFAEGLDGRTES